MNTYSPLDPHQCFSALQARDSRFDGRFFVGVSTTGIYCRPICRVKLPGRDRCTFYPSAAAAEQAGFRPCLRCRPELAPGLSREDAVYRLARRAADRIYAGALSEGSLEALADELGISSRQLRRAVEQAYGVSPLALAQTRRLLLAKQLLTDTRLRVIDVAFASGFASVRRFNDAFRHHYRLTPTALRKNGATSSTTGLTLRLGYRPPLDWASLMTFLGTRTASRASQVIDERFYSGVSMGEHRGWIVAGNDPERHQVLVDIAPSLLPVLAPLQQRLRQLFDLDADPEAIAATLKSHRVLNRSTCNRPGLRVPGTLDGFELAVRAIIGQQVSVKAASTVFARFVEAFGAALETPFPGLDRTPPLAGNVAKAKLDRIIKLGLNERRATTLQVLARHIAGGDIVLTPGTSVAHTTEKLLALPGIGPWTADYIAMRALGDPDALPAADLGLMKALNVDNAKAVSAAAETWRPWRAYGAMHLWTQLNAGG